ncbi:MAG TPA: hypothetical protein VMP01_28920 [Pirellulaceae bacterium]|nr:hypothetical protein [Pirellulaceae bacterium]
MQTPTLEELRSRLQREIDHFHGLLPERVALVWDGYFAALIEWGLISVAEHEELVKMLPEIPDNPVMTMYLGRKGDYE